MSEKIVLLKSFFSDIEAGMVKGALECEGIPAMIMRDDAGGMEPQFQLTMGVRLMVRQGDLERARQVLGEG